MKIAIVDDELFWRESVLKMTKSHYSDIEVDIDVFESGVHFLKAKKFYDIVIMDIEMPGIDGFDTIMEYRKEYGKVIAIILTTHMEISHKGYLVNAFRYVNKEKIKVELEEAFHASEHLLAVNNAVLLNVVGLKPIRVVVKDILFIETRKRNVIVHTEEKEYECSNSISSLEKSLSDCGFYRSHKSFLVNLDRIKNFDKKNIYFSNNQIAFLSTHKYAEFKMKYSERLVKIASM